MISAAVAILSVVAQLSSANPDVLCVLSRLPAETVSQMAAVMDGPSPSRPDEPLLPFSAALEACAREQSWPDARAEQAGALGFAAVTGAAAKERLAQAGIPPSRIDDWFRGQSEAVRAEVSAADGERLVAALVASGIPLESVSGKEDAIGFYLGSLILKERIERGLPID